jgi:hypothetical protein
MAEQADQLNALKSQRQLEAMQRAGQLGQGIRSQDFNEDASIAQARDVFAKARFDNLQNVMSSNVGARNLAADKRAMARQAQEDARVASLNQQEMHNKGLAQQTFGNKMDLARARAGALTGMGQAQSQGASNLAANQQQMWSGIGQAIGSAGKGYADYQQASNKKP